MSGSRMKLVKEALIYFLHSLPLDSYFNIISFGSTFQKMFPQSVQYTEENQENALNQVSYMEANLGGTEIFQPLADLYKKISRLKGYQRFVYLLTDGDVSDKQNIINLIKQQSSEDNKLFSMGIGNGCSKELITQAADAGRGLYEFIEDNQIMSDKIINILANSLQPNRKIIDFKFDKEIVMLISPYLADLKPIQNDQTLHFFVFLSDKFKEETEIELTIQNPATQKITKQTIRIQINDLIQQQLAEENSKVFKLGLHHILKHLANSQNKAIKKPLIYVNESQYQNFITKENLIKLALDYQILTPDTALICKIMPAADEIKQYIEEHKQAEKYFIPLTESIDYMDDQVQQIKKYAKNDQLQQQQGQIYLNSLDNYQHAKKGAGCCGGSSGGGYHYSEPQKLQQNQEFKKEFTQQQEKPKTIDTKSDLLEIIKLQKIQGFWEYSEKLLELLQIQKEKFQEAILEHKITNDQLITIVILIWLEEKHQNSQQSWNLIAQKANQYLQSQNLNVSEIKPQCKSTIFS